MAAVAFGMAPAVPADLDDLVALEERCFPLDPWSSGLLDEAVRGLLPTTRVFVARRSDDEALLGYAVVAAVDVDAELQRIAVAPADRRRGVAALVLDGVIAVVAARGARRMLLEVREDNAPALALYRRAGFVDLGRRERYYRDGTAALVLERDLAPTDDDTRPDSWRMTW